MPFAAEGRPIICRRLTPDDVVYTAGAPAMTDAVARIAKAAGARCYTDPFVQEHKGPEQAGLMSRLTGWLNEPKDKPDRDAAGATGKCRAPFGRDG